VAPVARTEGTHITHPVSCYTYAIRGRQIHPVVEIICDDDEAAKRRAKQLVGGRIELWKEARVITTIQPEE
jgi:methyl coenzyme M reductase subunit C